MFKLFSKSDELGPSEYKYALFTYRHLRKKMGEVLEAVFGGYPENKYIYYPPDDELSDYFSDIRNRFLEIDRMSEFMKLPVTDLRLFKIYSNYKDTSRLWEHLKKDIYEEDQMLLKSTQFDYYLPDDIQVAFHKIDELVKIHIAEKNKILNSNHIYPATKYYYGILVKKNSLRRKLLDYLSENNQKDITIQMLQDKLKRDTSYVWILINQLNKTFEKKQVNLRIESKNNHISLVTS